MLSMEKGKNLEMYLFFFCELSISFVITHYSEQQQQQQQ